MKTITKTKNKTKARSHIKKGDMVKVIAGNHKNASGKVRQVWLAKQRAIVEGVHMVTKHKKRDEQNPKGRIVKEEASLHTSNLMLIDPSTSQPTRTGRKKNEKGKLQRYAKKSQKFV